MEINLPDYLKKTLQKYREVFMEFMEYDENEKIDDDVLMNVALLSDMDYMLKELDGRKEMSL